MTLGVRQWTTLTAWGLGRDVFAAALKRRNAPPVSTLEVRSVGSVPFLKADLTAMKDYFPPRALRRVDGFGRMTLLLAADLVRERPAGERAPLGLIVATGFGSFSTNMEFLDTVFDGGHAAASPMVFSSTVHNSAMSAVSIHFGIRGPALTLSMFEQSVPGALLAAEAWLERGLCPEVLLIAADDLPALTAYYHVCRGDAPDLARPESLLAEGGAAFLLTPSGGPVLERADRPAAAVFSAGDPPSHAYAYGRSHLAPAFELAAACHALETPASGPAIALEFPGQPRWLLRQEA